VEADFSPTSSSVTSPSSPLSGSHTPAKSCANEQPKDGFQTCACTKETLGCSIHPNTPEEWIASMQASLVKTLASLENRPDLEKALAAGFTEKSCELLMSLNQDTSSWKTSRQSSLWEEMESDKSSPTFPRWGMTLGGSLYEHPMSARRITAIGGGVLQRAETYSGMWPSPTVADTRTDKLKSSQQKAGSMHSVTLAQAIQMWPTPQANKITESGELVNADGTQWDGKSKPHSKTTGRMVTTALADAVKARREQFATPQARDFRSGQSSRWDDPNRSRNLNDQVAKFPTPSASDYKGAGATGKLRHRLDYAVERGAAKSKIFEANTTGGKLNPHWVAWLMGWPLQFTQVKEFRKKGLESRLAGGKSSRKSDESQPDANTERISSRPLETDKPPCKPQSHGDCLGVNK